MNYFLPSSLQKKNMKKNEDTNVSIRPSSEYIDHLYNNNSNSISNNNNSNDINSINIFNKDNNSDSDNGLILGHPVNEIQSLLSSPINNKNSIKYNANK